MAITITYNGTTTTVEDGKTATLPCAGKIMLSDVVVGTASAEGYRVGICAYGHNGASDMLFFKDGYDESVGPTHYDVMVNGNEDGVITVTHGYLSVYAFSSAWHEDMDYMFDARTEDIHTGMDVPEVVYSAMDLDSDGSYRVILEIKEDIPNLLIGFYIND